MATEGDKFSHHNKVSKHPKTFLKPLLQHNQFLHCRPVCSICSKHYCFAKIWLNTALSAEFWKGWWSIHKSTALILVKWRDWVWMDSREFLLTGAVDTNEDLRLDSLKTWLMTCKQNINVSGFDLVKSSLEYSVSEMQKSELWKKKKHGTLIVGIQRHERLSTYLQVADEELWLNLDFSSRNWDLNWDWTWTCPKRLQNSSAIDVLILSSTIKTASVLYEGWSTNFLQSDIQYVFMTDE